jgi:cytochrome b involved in lipid metabolism
MKFLVLAVMIIYLIFMGSVATYGFLQKQQKESEINKTTQSSKDRPPEQWQTQSTNTATTTPAQPAGFSVAEVAKHNKPTDCWLIISADVYDVSTYLEFHPGGADIIIPYCGRDATQAFNTQGGRGKHSSQATQELQKHLLGPLR